MAAATTSTRTGSARTRDGPGTLRDPLPIALHAERLDRLECDLEREPPQLSLQFNVENLSNNVYLLSKESTMVQGQYSIPRLLSGSLKIGF